MCGHAVRPEFTQYPVFFYIANDGKARYTFFKVQKLCLCLIAKLICQTNSFKIFLITLVAVS